MSFGSAPQQRLSALNFLRNNYEKKLQLTILKCADNSKTLVHIFTGRNEVVAKVIVLHLSVILFTGEGLPQCMLGYHPPGSRHPLGAGTHPWEQVHPGAATPQEQAFDSSRHPPGAGTPPRSRHPLSPHGIRSMSGWYASYWNAFLFPMVLL